MMQSFNLLFISLIYGLAYYYGASRLYGLRKVQMPLSFAFVPLSMVLTFAYGGATLNQVLIYTICIGIFYAIFLSERRCLGNAIVEFYATGVLARLVACAIILFTENRMVDFRGYLFSTKLIDTLIFAFVFMLICKIKTIFVMNEKISRLNTVELRFVSMMNAGLMVAFIVMASFYVKHLSTKWVLLTGLDSIKGILVFGFILFVLVFLIIRAFITMTFYGNVKYRVLNEKASSDSLTGVMAREAGIRTLKKLMREVKLTHKHLTVGFVDINNLKVVNDKFGHSEGDKLIENVSSLIKNNLRRTEFVARLGGDEFLIIFYNSTLENSKRIWQRILEKIDIHNQEQSAGYDITVSIGFAEYQHDKHPGAKELINDADKEMYANKRLTKSSR